MFELQFIDFLGPAYNQLVNQIATLRWRTAGEYKCPMVILAPCGGYLGCGGPWHSQTSESLLAHAPGLKVFMPSRPYTAAQLLAAAVQGDDPVILLLPKNLFREKLDCGPALLHPEQATILREGTDITIVAWGNTLNIAQKAVEELHDIDTEVIDLHSMVPCDWNTLYKSVAKTGRLLIIQEDNRSCSFGQALIAECMANPAVWKKMKAAPVLVSRPDVHVGFHPKLEASVLPQTNDVIRKLKELMDIA